MFEIQSLDQPCLPAYCQYSHLFITDNTVYIICMCISCHVDFSKCKYSLVHMHTIDSVLFNYRCSNAPDSVLPLLPLLLHSPTLKLHAVSMDMIVIRYWIRDQ